MSNRRNTNWCERDCRRARSRGPATLVVPASTVGLAFLCQGASEDPARLLVRAGTPVRLVLSESVNSLTSRPGQTILFELAGDVTVDGLTLVRRGARAEGVPGEQIKRAPSLSRPGRVELSASRSSQ